MPNHGRAPTISFGGPPSTCLPPSSLYPSPIPSFCFTCFLSLPLFLRPHFLSLRARPSLSSINGDCSSENYMRKSIKLRGHWPWAKLGSGRLLVMGGHLIGVFELCIHVVVLLFSRKPTGKSWSQNAHHTPLFKMVPFIPDESAQIIDTHFCAKKKTLQVYPSQTDLYFEVTIPNSHSWWKLLPNSL